MSQGQAKPKTSRLWRAVRWLCLVAVLLPPVQVLALRWVDPPFSSFMMIRQFEAWRAGQWEYRLQHQWQPLAALSPQLPLAVLAAEDQRFFLHRGFDFEAIEAAQRKNARGGALRGGSTLSQQTAKNLFLWSGRGWTRWLRKGLETYYTFWMERFLPKSRIMTLYLNFAEFGDGVYGGEAASRRFFAKPAGQLHAAEAARLAAVLPNPKRYSVTRPGPHVRRRSAAITRQMRLMGGVAYWQQQLRQEK